MSTSENLPHFSARPTPEAPQAQPSDQTLHTYAKALTAIIANAPYAFMVVVEDRLTDANHATERLLGRPLAELKGSPLLQHVLPESHASIQELCRSTGENQPPSGQTIRLRAADGSPRPVALAAIRALYQEQPATVLFVQEGAPTPAASMETRVTDATCYHAVLKAAQEAILIHRNGRFVYLNEPAVQLFGARSAEALIGRSIFERIHPSKRELTERRLRLLMATHQPLPPLETTWLRLDGAEVRVIVTSVRLQPGHPEESIAVFANDITPHHPIATQPQQRDALIRSIYRTTPNPIGIVIDDTVVEANPAMCTLLGYSQDELTYFPTERLHTSDTELKRVRQEVQTQCAHGGVATVQTQWFHRDGHPIDIILRSNFIYPDNPSLGRIFTAQDITQQKINERTIAANAAELRAIYEGAPILMFLLDETLHCRRINLRAREFTGLSEEEALGRSIHQLLGCVQRPTAEASPTAECSHCALLRALKDASHESSRQESEVRLELLRGGQLRTFDLRVFATPIVDDEGRWTLLCLEDITTQKQLREQSLQTQKMEILGQLASGVAHDFNNTLAALTLHLGLLETHPEASPRIRQEVQDILSEIRHGSNLTRQLLLFSRRKEPSLQQLDLNTVIRDLLKLLRHLIGMRVQLVFEPAKVPFLIIADQSMIEQIVMNLCINARDAMPEGGTLSLRTCQTVADGRPRGIPAASRTGTWGHLIVADTGCGMPPAIVQRIFEPFFTTKGARGTGLGLATVRHAVERHQGWIEVTSTPGLGSLLRSASHLKTRRQPAIHDPIKDFPH